MLKGFRKYVRKSQMQTLKVTFVDVGAFETFILNCNYILRKLDIPTSFWLCEEINIKKYIHPLGFVNL